jgi:hypothetical protein
MQASLLNGAYPKANFTLIEHMRAKAGSPSVKCDVAVATMLAYKVEDEEEYPTYHVSSDEVWARYDLTPLEVAELELEFGHSTYTHHYYSSGTNKILELDYGLTGRELTLDEGPACMDH